MSSDKDPNLGKNARDYFGIPVKTADGVTIPWFAVCGDVVCDEPLVCFSGSEEVAKISPERLTSVVRVANHAVVALDGYVWRWSLAALDQETYAEYCTRVSDTPRPMLAREGWSVQLPEDAVAYSLSTLLDTGIRCMLVDDTFHRTIPNGPTAPGTYAFHYWEKYWVWTIPVKE